MDHRQLILVFLIFLSSCAIPVSQVPLAKPLQPSSGGQFVINDDTKVSISTGFSRNLRSGTHWVEVGTVDMGRVYRSSDQVLTVEGFDVHEAYIVVTNMRLIGFYLPVEKTFVRASKEVVLNAQNN